MKRNFVSYYSFLTLMLLFLLSPFRVYGDDIYWYVIDGWGLEDMRYSSAADACRAGIAEKESRHPTGYEWRIVGEFYSGGSYAWGNMPKKPGDEGFNASATELYCTHEYHKLSEPSTWWKTFWPYSGANVRMLGDVCPVGQSWDPIHFGCRYDKVTFDDNCPNMTEKPINIATGNKYYREQDFIGEGLFPLRFRRYYNSYAQGSAGLGWSFDYLQSLDLNVATEVVAKRPGGKEITFSQASPGGSWISSFAQKERLYSNSDGTWRLESGSVIELYDSQGKLTSLRQRQGPAHTLSYVGNQILVTRLTQTMTFNLNALGQVQSLTQPDGALISYNYATRTDIKKLQSVQLPDSSKHYFYTDSRHPLFITRVENGEGKVLSAVSYDEKGRATSSGFANGASQTSIEYSTGSAIWRRVTNALGKSSLYHYSFEGSNQYPLITQVEGEASSQCVASDSRYEYDSRGFKSQFIDRNGNVTNYINDDMGREISRVEAVGTQVEREITTEWNENFSLPSRIIEPNNTSEFTYDAEGRLLQQSLIAGQKVRSTTYSYNTEGLLLSIDGPRTDVSDVSQFDYDAQSGFRLSSLDALGHTTQFTQHDAMGRVLTMVDANGVSTELAWSAEGRLLSTRLKDPGGDIAQDLVTQYSYNQNGDIVQVVQPDGQTQSFEYDFAHRLVAIENDLGERIEYTLDLAGNRVSEQVSNSSGALKKTLSRTFDELSRVISITGAAGQTELYEYDLNDNPIKTIDGRLHETMQSFDALDRLADSTDPNLGVTGFTHDSSGRIATVTDPRGLTTQYTYDGLGNMLTRSSPDTGLSSYTHDAAGNILSETDARDVTKEFTYDALNRLVSVVYPGNSEKDVFYDYDDTSEGNHGIGRLTGIADELGFTFYQYDSRGRVVEKTVDLSGTFSRTQYEYDLAGRLILMEYPGGRSVRYERDALGRISAVYSRSWEGAPENVVANAFTYLPFGPMSGFTLGNGAVRSLNFDQDYRVSALSTTGLESILDRSYAYDTTDNITSIDNLSDLSASQTFDYDELSRLSEALGSYGDQSYLYDLAGNRTQLSVLNGGTQAYHYALDSNRLLSVDSSPEQTSREISYDVVGNTIFDSLSGNTLVYGQSNRLETSQAGSISTHYLYNSLGLRVAKQSSQNGFNDQTLFHYDESGNLLAEHAADGRVRKQYIYADGVRISMLVYGASTDLDNDGLDDDWELQFFGSLAESAQGDFDGDGYSNEEEFIAGTEANNAVSQPEVSSDGDGDGMPDAWELMYFNTLDQDASTDFDGDGLLDLKEYQLGHSPIRDSMTWLVPVLYLD